eukprot:sb/3476234/
MDKNTAKGLAGIENRLLISDRAHIVTDAHQTVDGANEKASGSLGTTKKGIGPTYSSKMKRNNLRMVDLLGDEAALKEKLTKLLTEFAQAYPGETFDVEAQWERLRGYLGRVRPMIKVGF